MFVEIFHRICCRWSECFFKVKIKFSREKIRKHFWQVQEEILELSQVCSSKNLKKLANDLLSKKVLRHHREVSFCTYRRNILSPLKFFIRNFRRISYSWYRNFGLCFCRNYEATNFLLRGFVYIIFGHS